MPSRRNKLASGRRLMGSDIVWLGIPMRIIPTFLVFAVLLAAPARSEDRTETIRFQYLTALEAQEQLLDPVEDLPRGKIRPFVVDRGAGRHGLIPAGIKALSVDERGNALLVTGEAGAIQQLQRILRLLDIPRRVLRLTVRTARIPLADLAPENRKPVEEAGIGSLILTDMGRKAAELAPASLTTTLLVSNNRALHLILPRVNGQQALPLSVVPRINGDNSVTLIISSRERREPEAGSGVLVLHRVGAGETMALSGGPIRETLVIRAEIVPDP